jgi:hypothetical protein
MKKSLLLWVPLLILLFLGCAKTPMASPERDLAAKSFAPVPGMAVVCIYRDGNDGGSIKIPLLVDHRAICDTVAKSYIRLELEPGGRPVRPWGGPAVLSRLPAASPCAQTGAPAALRAVRKYLW